MNRRKTKLRKYTMVLAASTFYFSFLHVFCTVSLLLITILQTHDIPVTVKFMFSCENDD